jgi:hypothetical protein
MQSALSDIGKGDRGQCVCGMNAELIHACELCACVYQAGVRRQGSQEGRLGSNGHAKSTQMKAWKMYLLRRREMCTVLHQWW